MAGAGAETFTSYDEIPYPGFPYPEAHPDRLATIATLLGLSPAPPERCRVLELGCGDGGNLIPMAWALPGSRFVGVELSRRAVEAACAEIGALGLTNVQVHRMDLCEIGPEFGVFDYVIAHGLYSWVPDAVREKILDVARAHLAPHGVAYVSYDTYPGGRLREAAREMMLYHARRAADPATKVRLARDLLAALRAGLSPEDPYRAFVTVEIERLAARADPCLYHDQLADVYQPVYFHEFVAQAERHSLQYLGEANFFDMCVPPIPAGTAEILGAAVEAPLASEQYRDFLRCRCFRRTLLCRREAPVDRTVAPERLESMYAASAFAPAQPPDLQPDVPIEFHGPRGRKAVSDHPLAKAALCELAECRPAALAFSDLLRQVQDALAPAEAGARSLAEMLLQAYAADVIELHVWAAPIATRAGERPQASALARRQAASRSEVTTLRHTTVRLESERERRLLGLLDGTRDRAALLRDLGLPGVSAEQLEENLLRLARFGLLVC